MGKIRDLARRIKPSHINGIVKIIVTLIIIGVIVFIALHAPVLLHWLAVHTGSSTVVADQPYYNFWSGFGSDLSEFALIGSVIGLYYKHNCHTKGCLRIGRHVVDGTPWCNKHHVVARKKTDG